MVVPEVDDCSVQYAFDSLTNEFDGNDEPLSGAYFSTEQNVYLKSSVREDAPSKMLPLTELFCAGAVVGGVGIEGSSSLRHHQNSRKPKLRRRSLLR